jgi:hypothetical protein
MEKITLASYLFLMENICGSAIQVSDELAGHYFFGFYYDLVAETEEDDSRREVVKVVTESNKQ